ncbi:MAG: phosphoglucosamine mutase [Rickettsiales bacterium]|nr:phosphoglucosamine mutase [Rickettsiales bacterium]
MTRQYFGTDGIRGRANNSPMTAEIALKVGMAAGRQFNRGDHRHRVVIAKDTRLSGYMIENALASGFLSVGMHVYLVGPLPTPAVGMLTRSMRADIGVMISASHNAYQDNGIKLFGPDGYKLSDEIEKAIEERMNAGFEDSLAPSEEIGRARRIDDAQGRYIEFVKRSFPKDMRLEGLKVVIDCANGAGYVVGPIILWELGAEVITMGVEPNGTNINKDCGSTHPQALCERVVAEGADIGIALDGDADRLIVCDEKGQVLDGDQLMAMVARRWHEKGVLSGGGVVSTLMSNLGFERYIESLGLNFHRTQVGDRYVVEKMRELDCNVGGEQSGHIVLRDYSTTGDGLIAALQVLAVLLEDGRPMSEAGRVFEPVPQLLKNARYTGGNPLETAAVQAVIEEAEATLGKQGRLVIRKSGTEPLIRVMAEGADANEVERLVDQIVDVIEAESGDEPKAAHG